MTMSLPCEALRRLGRIGALVATPATPPAPGLTRSHCAGSADPDHYNDLLYSVHNEIHPQARTTARVVWDENG